MKQAEKVEPAETKAVVSYEEKARKEALRPDREKLIAWANRISEALLSEPELSSKDARGIAHQAVFAIQDEVNEIKNQAEAL